MLAQNSLTGYFHEVPDSQLYDMGFAQVPEQFAEGQVVYDGFGNPVGFLPFIPKIASLATKVLPLFQSLFRRRSPAAPASMPMLPPAPFMTPPSPPAVTMPEGAPAAEATMGEVIYDGLGNPVGFLPFIPKIASLATSAIPAIARAIPGIARAIPGVQSLVPGVFPGGAPAPMPGAMPAFGPFGPTLVRPPLPFRPPWPRGWIRPPLPYTGLGPRRLYMRCAVWPGPQGLVPASAAQAPPAVQVPAAMTTLRRRRVRRRR
jgi:hypothetical protein